MSRIFFSIVNQFNYSLDLLESDAEKQILIDLNIKAGEKARKSVAYTAALNYFEMAWCLLPEDHWTGDPNLSFQIAILRMETAYLNGNLDLAFGHRRRDSGKGSNRLRICQGS